MDPRQVIGERYRLIRRLGKGGQAVVWEAEELVGGQSCNPPAKVAIKAFDLWSELEAEIEAEVRAAFFTEVRALAGLSHPGIVGYRNWFPHEDRRRDPPEAWLCVVTELAPGNTLARMLTALASKDAETRRTEARRTLYPVAQALEYLGREGHAHRDVKPENILLFSDGAKLADFGIARQILSTKTRVTNLGTAGYLAPELVAGEPAGVSIDVYSFGVVLWEAGQGQRLNGGQPVISAAWPDDWRALLTGCLQRDPVRRWSAVQVREALADMEAEQERTRIRVLTHTRDTALREAEAHKAELDRRVAELGRLRTELTSARVQREAAEAAENAAEARAREARTQVVLAHRSGVEEARAEAEGRVEAALADKAVAEAAAAGARAAAEAEREARKAAEEAASRTRRQLTADKATLEARLHAAEQQARGAGALQQELAAAQEARDAAQGAMAQTRRALEEAQHRLNMFETAPSRPMRSAVSAGVALILAAGLGWGWYGAASTTDRASTSLSEMQSDLEKATRNLPSTFGPGGVEWVYSIPAGLYFTRSEVTVAQFQACVDAGACDADKLDGFGWEKDPRGRFEAQAFTKSEFCNWSKRRERKDHPLNCVTAHQAEAFCAWAKGRLPTDAEWLAEASHRGRRTYPWGEEPPSCRRTVMGEGGGGCKKDRTWPACSLPAGDSVSGLCDMSGNVWEWVGSSDSDGLRGLRGGSWLNENEANLRASARSEVAPSFRPYDIGFRCVFPPQV